MSSRSSDKYIIIDNKYYYYNGDGIWLSANNALSSFRQRRDISNVTDTVNSIRRYQYTFYNNNYIWNSRDREYREIRRNDYIIGKYPVNFTFLSSQTYYQTVLPAIKKMFGDIFPKNTNILFTTFIRYILNHEYDDNMYIILHRGVLHAKIVKAIFEDMYDEYQLTTSGTIKCCHLPNDAGKFVLLDIDAIPGELDKIKLFNKVINTKFGKPVIILYRDDIYCDRKFNVDDSYINADNDQNAIDKFITTITTATTSQPQIKICIGLRKKYRTFYGTWDLSDVIDMIYSRNIYNSINMANTAK